MAACHASVFSRFIIETDLKLTSRGSITNLHNKYVEDPVRAIIQQLKQVEEVSRAFQIRDSIVFENHPHALSDVAEEVMDRETPSTPPRTPDHRRDLNQLQPDQICIYQSDNTLSSRHTMVYISEYKPPYKLTALHLHLSLCAIDIYKEVINQRTVLTSIDPDARFQYYAEKLMASAITQTYYYIIKSGLKYGLLTTGEAIVFLKTWAKDFESTLRSIPENERSASSDYSPTYEPTTYKGVDQSPALPRKRTRRTAMCQIGEGSLRKDNGQEPSNNKSASRPPDTPTPTRRNTRQGTRRSQRLALRPRGGGGKQGRQYYTQKYLLGIVRGGFLDPKCPNMALHCKSCAPACARHPSLDDEIRPLGEGGARGMLFQVTLLAHGYTFISKGIVQAFIRDLEHEAAVYEHLKLIQGVHVPVFLGAINLRSINKTYYYDHRVYVRISDSNRSLEDKAIRSLRAMHREGVVHKDVRLANMLFNPEIKGVMVIDFERALLLKPARRPLAQLVPNKRAWKSETMDAKKVTGDSSKRSQASQSFSEDIWLAKTAFLEWNADRWTRVARAPC
ncbi:hypothetical protein FOC4_g10000137 [Fusarium odoratissimum]|uniref:EKC/KEOPS complex subunit BUD32 n=1 Tax=Fusarium oxysporum f. sp. cubense (strain race 4) TaxID=2502994 RepID=N1S730_FUSC4|nr:hypothetical protein FOC4_g10000137 [Fusarium odoratissimum]